MWSMIFSVTVKSQGLTSRHRRTNVSEAGGEAGGSVTKTALLFSTEARSPRQPPVRMAHSAPKKGGMSRRADGTISKAAPHGGNEAGKSVSKSDALIVRQNYRPMLATPLGTSADEG